LRQELESIAVASSDHALEDEESIDRIHADIVVDIRIAQEEAPRWRGALVAALPQANDELLNE
jgi:hypothetical protein